MDADQRPMISDATIDRELQALLAVGPSAEFAARVRTRIADDPVRRATWFPLALVVAAAAAAVIAAIVVTRQVTVRPGTERSAKAVALHESRPVALHGAQPIALLDARPLQPVLPLQPIRPILPLRRVLPLRPVQALQPVLDAQRRLEPEILIDAREASALRSLISRASGGRIEMRLVSTDLAPLEDVSIEPLVIVPLEEGARQ